MSDIEKLGIGNVITTHQEKDAIHIAIVPVVIGENMFPGTPIVLAEDFKETGRVIRAVDKLPIGVIDPFYYDEFREAQRAWLFLNPGSIISLRHEWTHPLLVDDETRNKSEKWLRDFCESHDCPRYETVMRAVQDDFDSDDDYGRSGYIDEDYLHFSGRDAHGKIPSEFWDHVEIVLGKRVDYKPKYFSCSC